MATIETPFELAIEIAANAHAGMPDKQGKPYVLHPIRVMLGVESEEAQIVALLHDVVEDTDTSPDDIRDHGFGPEVIDALNLVTHQKDQTYAEYVIGCKGNEIARQVKMSDLRDNTSLSRLLLRQEKFDDDAIRMQRYFLSYRFLTDEISEDDYRRMMANLEKHKASNQ